MFFVVKKKTVFLYIAVFLVFLVFCGVYAKYSSENYPPFDKTHIIIDPGHGGEDGGAVGKAGTLEKDLNLKVALELKELLSSKGYKIIMTRDSDKLNYEADEARNKKRADTKYRLKVARDNPGALFISIHMNSFQDAASKGSQVFYSVKNPESKEIAATMRNCFKEIVDAENNREIKEAYNTIYVMKNIESPAVLIECGFISNRIEEAKLNNAEYRAKITQAIASAIEKHISEKQ